jgi:hypothetical protein
MTVTNKRSTVEAAGLWTASQADIELDHLERMVQYVTRRDAGNPPTGLDQGYWEQRLRALVQTHDLMVAQRRRVIMLLDLLEREALFRTRSRTTA